MIEIDENLCRSDLSAAQRSASVKRRKEIWEALYPADKLQVAQVEPPEIGQSLANLPEPELGGKSFPTQLDSRGQRKSPQKKKEFAAETSELTGQSKRSINQHLARAEALGDDINEVVGTNLDKDCRSLIAFHKRQIDNGIFAFDCLMITATVNTRCGSK